MEQNVPRFRKCYYHMPEGIESQFVMSLERLNFLTSVCLNSHHTAASTSVSATDRIMHLIIWHHLHHGILVFEQPAVQRTLLKMLNNKNCQRVLEKEKQPRLFWCHLYAWNNLPTPTPTSINALPLSFLSKFTLIHFLGILSWRQPRLEQKWGREHALPWEHGSVCPAIHKGSTQQVTVWAIYAITCVCCFHLYSNNLSLSLLQGWLATLEGPAF